MARRSRARDVAMQVLFQEDLSSRAVPLEDEAFVRRRIREEELRAFCLSLIWGTRKNRIELDELLDNAAENWSLMRMAATDRNVLRIGAFEILHTETPDRVVINEAVELAKRYGAVHSPQFVNGILDRLLEKHDK